MSFKYYVMLLFTYLSAPTFAEEEWFCTGQSSQRIGDEIQACGVATGKDENIARMKAFNNAKAEFKQICDESEDCKDHNVRIEPKRTTCEKEQDSYKCYRLISFIIVSPKYKINVAEVQPKLDDIETPDLPQVKKGMSKKAVLEAFGTPLQVNPAMWDPEIMEFMYEGKMCQYMFCYIKIKNNRVVGHQDLKPTYTDVLN